MKVNVSQPESASTMAGEPAASGFHASAMPIPATNGHSNDSNDTTTPTATEIVPSAETASSANGPDLSADDIELYDRQIRLWGVQAQQKIRGAQVLLIGLRGLGNEVAKNLVLAGIGSLTVVDDQVVAEDDLGAQFFVRAEDVGKNVSRASVLRRGGF